MKIKIQSVLKVFTNRIRLQLNCVHVENQIDVDPDATCINYPQYD